VTTDFSDPASTAVSQMVLSVCLSVNHATGYARQHIWCLSQARINWEGCDRKASDIKMGND